MNKKTKTIVVVGGLGVAAAIIIYRLNTDKPLNEEFKQGYLAGFVTPGPFTILAIVGVVAYAS